MKFENKPNNFKKDTKMITNKQFAYKLNELMTHTSEYNTIAMELPTLDADDKDCHDCDISDFFSYWKENIKLDNYSPCQSSIEYLKMCDENLEDSIKIAIREGYKLKDITSDLLATLLYQNEKLELLHELRDKIEEWVKELPQAELPTNDCIGSSGYIL